MTEHNVCENKCCEFSQLKIYTTNRFIPHSKWKAGVILYDVKEEMVLLIQSNNNLWGFPKGSFKTKETKKLCAIRELKEETGISIPASYLYNEHIIKQTNFYYIVHYPKCKVSIQHNKDNDDATGIGWFRLKCLTKLISTKKIKLNYHTRKLLKKIFNVFLSI